MGLIVDRGLRRYLVRAILIRHKTVSDDEVKICLLPARLYVLFDRPTTERDIPTSVCDETVSVTGFVSNKSSLSAKE